ncbi:PaaX domain-containing protein [Halorubrum sp. CBA1229]|uniref:PaaX domain-containing protein n=1 Tax=Halorubrum sp. CBA1229 TaxID=1853699 RepID=UPI000F406AC5|nr:PaaX domain-containing protein [Halorubrum sp. CBA1229]QKY15544.1 PaaX domain-containing protein [Halorubrum sp. CBA1229]
MPVDLLKSDPYDTINVRLGTNKAAIIKLLYQDTNLAYTPADIREVLDLPRGTTSTTLSRHYDDGLIGKTSDGLYHGLESRDEVRRFARSLVQLDDMATRYPDPGLTPDDVEQTGEGARLPHDRAGADSVKSEEEPAPTEWVDSTDTASSPDTDSASDGVSDDGR